MSLQSCQTGSTQGFPISISQNIFTKWAGPIPYPSQSIIVPTDITVNWGPTSSLGIYVTQNASLFQINGLEPIAYNTTLTYGAATYSCSPIISIVQNQHRNLQYNWGNEQQYEMILAFQLRGKGYNPSSPDVILLSRPLIMTTDQTTPFWNAVNTSVKTQQQQGVSNFDMSSLFAYKQYILKPMISYSTCLPAKILNYSTSTPSQIGSISVRVHVVTQPMYVTADSTGTGLCSVINKYNLAIPGRPATLFLYSAWNGIFQFQDGLGTDTFPAGNSENLVPLASTTKITDAPTVQQTFEFLVPEDFLGKSIDEISNIAEHTAKAAPTKTFKCYKIDPDTDIKNGQILIDPTTGESLADTMVQKIGNDSGGDPSLINVSVDNPGIMPGDVQYAFWIICTVIGTLAMVAYASYIIYAGYTYGVNSVKFHIGGWSILFISLIIGVNYGKESIQDH